MSKLINKCNNKTTLRMSTILMEISYKRKQYCNELTIAMKMSLDELRVS